MANLSGYNFAYLDEQTKRMIRRAILKAVAIPGYQVPFGGREMPMPYGWGTGGIQLTASVIGESDVLKVIDQGADDTTNAVSIRNFFKRVTGVNTTERTDDATLIQTRHRIPETPLTEDQIIIFQVPIPEPLRFIEPRETETRTMHALEEYGVMQVKLYEDIARFGHIATTYAYPVKVNGRYVMDPSPIPKFDNPKMDMMPALQLFGAGREKRIYAVPPFTRVHYSSGRSEVTENVADIYNSGWEIDLGVTLLKNKSFQWYAKANIAINDNKVKNTYYKETKDLPKATLSNAHQFVENQPVNGWYGYKFAGINPINDEQGREASVGWNERWY